MKHVDFQVVSMKEKLRVQVAIELSGESSAIKTLNGILVTNMDSVEVECFPQDLPARLMVDISSMKQIGDSILVRDLVAPEKVEILDDPSEVICVITGQAAEEVVPVVETVVAETEPEVIEKGKKEEEEGF
jgi:large subunit ribosomal protein L25